MISELFLQDLSLWSCVWQSTLLLMIGLAGSFLLRRRPARAFQVLFVAMMATVAVPVMSVLVKHFEIGAFVAEPVALKPVSMDLYSAVPSKASEAMIEPQVTAEGRLDNALVKGRSVGIDIPWRMILLLCWITATLALFGRLLFAFINGMHLIQRSQPEVRAHIQQALDQARTRLGIGKTLVIRASGEIRSPMIWCWSRSAVLLVPHDSNKNVDWVGIICHELAHYKRRDHIRGLMTELTACILCWNPLSWQAKERLVRLSEQACDDWVVVGGQPVENYARSLLNFKPQKQAAFVPAVVHSRTGVAARIRRILQDSCADPRAGVKWALAAGVLTASFAVGIAFAQTRPAKPATVTAQRQAEPSVSLHRAAAIGNIEQVKLLISKGADVNAKNNNGETALHVAIQGERKEIVEVLLTEGAAINIKDKQGYTPLVYALWSWDYYKELMPLFIAKCADVNHEPEDHHPPMYFAVWSEDLDNVKLLVAKGAKFDAKISDDKTPFQYAVGQGSRDIVEFLVSKGAQIAPFHLAACMGNLSKVKSLVEQGTDLDAKDEFGWTPLYWAASLDRTEVAKFLIDKGADFRTAMSDSGTVLYQAAQAGDCELVELLLSKGANIHDVDARGMNGRTPLYIAALRDQRDMVKLLISEGANINASAKIDRTALHAVAITGQKAMAALLIDEGADMNCRDRRGLTPLHFAARLGRTDIVDLLVSKGADVNAKDKRTRTPLHYAAEEGHKKTVELLLAHGADVKAGNSLNKTAAVFAMGGGHTEIVELLISKGADISPLHLAIYLKDEARAKSLIESGADVSKRTPFGQTPLDRAVSAGLTDIVRLLIDRGADVNAKDNWDWTPLHSAIYSSKDIVELLIAHGANLNTKDGGSRTPLKRAVDGGLIEMEDLLRKHGAKE